MHANYFFIDGSSLCSQIRRLRKTDNAFLGRKLDPVAFINHFLSACADLIGGGYKRATFYFPKGDEVAAGEYIEMPQFRKPGAVRDLHFKFCGQKLKGSTEFNKLVEEFIPPKFQDRVSKSEKGVDIEISCDALKLASASRLDRLFLFTNDDDFAPLCRTLKEFGANVSLIHLFERINPNESLLAETDSYDVVPAGALERMFVVSPVELEEPSQPAAELADEPEDTPQETAQPESPPHEAAQPAADEGARLADNSASEGESTADSRQ
jgi:uncharacterized LabA/DUF88 family protein